MIVLPKDDWDKTKGRFNKSGDIYDYVTGKKILPVLGDEITIYELDFNIYFPNTSYVAYDYSWCYINNYLFEIIGKYSEDNVRYCGKVIAIL